MSADGPAGSGQRQSLGNGEAAVLAVSSGGSSDLAAGPRGGLPGRWLRLWSLVLAGGLTLHGTVLSRRVPGGELVWYVLAILVGIAYLLLTVGAPDIGPFADPAAAAMGTIPF